jgi:6-phosphogluconate dehydrogenase
VCVARRARRALEPPRAVWVMVPAGDPTESTSRRSAPALGRRHDRRRRQHQLSRRRAAARSARRKADPLRRCRHERRHLGLQEGYCLMVGGDAEVCAGSSRSS